MIANLGVGLNEKSGPALRMARKSGTAIAGPAGPPTPPLSRDAAAKKYRYKSSRDK